MTTMLSNFAIGCLPKLVFVAKEEEDVPRVYRNHCCEYSSQQCRNGLRMLQVTDPRDGGYSDIEGYFDHGVIQDYKYKLKANCTLDQLHDQMVGTYGYIVQPFCFYQTVNPETCTLFMKQQLGKLQARMVEEVTYDNEVVVTDLRKYVNDFFTHHVTQVMGKDKHFVKDLFTVVFIARQLAVGMNVADCNVHVFNVSNW